MNIDIIKNITFEHSNTDRLRILNTRNRIRTDKNPTQNRIRTDKNPTRPDQIRIRSGNIRTIFMQQTQL